MTIATAVVQVGPRKLEFQEFPVPEDLEPGAAIIRVEANGLCASDVDQFEGTDPHFAIGDSARYPRIMGHEIVGIVDSMGERTPARASLNIGDRIAINPYCSCGRCEACATGDLAHCTGWKTTSNVLGHIPTTFGSGLWGGYSTHVYVHPNSQIYTFPAHVSPLDATLWNPLGGGIQWAVMNTGMKPGASVAVLGCGQRGLACLVAVKSAGAGTVMTSGLASDQHKLDLALTLGADAAVNIEKDSVVERARELTGGRGFDMVVDTTPHAFQPIHDAIEMLRPNGALVTVGIKTKAMPDFPIDKVTLKGLRIFGSLGQSDEAYSRAASLVSEGTFPLSKMRTHVLGFDRLEEAIELVQGKRAGERAINVVVTPTFSG
ncbi:zinc-dependent alcohol dehydrogenase [Rhodococcus erythropolis]|uniref:zinc-dependent alcohol dehydrogenase n=1 Tax=Rhodococcus erythropolis TaxID=1833 RepID=UPI0022273A3C|nr:zinc-binding dehydrogenase [Rhodococcus erythropolis]MCW2295422.1 threonine dehydrogenase-like Zn-dependent dehydrogenase [Rhodococcus erythropolis]